MGQLSLSLFSLYTWMTSEVLSGMCALQTKGVQKGSAKERMHAKLQVIGNFGDFELVSDQLAMN
jgi:hypothetical protein